MEVNGLSVTVIDPRMDELTRDREIVVKKAEQKVKEDSIIGRKISKTDKRSIAFKLQKRKEVKSLA